MGRLFRTVRYMRPKQIINRITRRLRLKPTLTGPSPTPNLSAVAWRNAAGRIPTMTAPLRFHFLGEDGEIKTPDDWNDASRPMLWLYNLHYFDDLRADNAAQRVEWHRSLIKRWRLENTPALSIGWEPYPSSLRIVNWIAWALSGEELDAQTLQSLVAQVRHLRTTLEFHLLGNHLLANAKALVFAGCFFAGPEAKGWLTTGLRLLNAELQEQVLDDGGHFELSTMYHAVVLEDLLDLIQLGRIFPTELGFETQAWKVLATRMLAWLSAMTHPDGEISFFNDAASGVARTYAALASYASDLEVTQQSDASQLRRLAASGYFRLEVPPFCTFFDAAEIGPFYLPGHGHADALSIEVSVHGQRLLTNSGTSTYAPGGLRDDERATSSHATLEIDGYDSSEVWASFRVGRRARPFDVNCGMTDNGVWAEACHDGYRWLPGKPVHKRRIEVSSSTLRILDQVIGGTSHSVVSRLPLHPSVAAISQDTDGWKLELNGGCILDVRTIGPVRLSIAEGFYAPTFGRRVQRPVLTWQYEGRLPLTVETRFELKRANSFADR